MRKNISVIEWFGVFSIVTACACIESRLGATRTIFSERRRADLTATLVRAQGGKSPAEFARSMSRRQIIQRREFSLLPGTDWHSNTLPKCVSRSENDPEADPCLVTPLSCRIAETADCWTLGHARGPAVLRVGQLVEQPRAELIDATGLLAGLVFQQVRPGSHAAAGAGLPSSSRMKLGPVLVGTPDVESLFSLRSERPVATTPASSPEPVPAPIEILFAELASRRLRNLATRNKP